MDPVIHATRQSDHRGSSTDHETVDDGHRGDTGVSRTHRLKERVLRLICADDGPRRTVVDHVLVWFLRTRRRLQTHTTHLTTSARSSCKSLPKYGGGHCYSFAIQSNLNDIT